MNLPDAEGADGTPYGTAGRDAASGGEASVGAAGAGQTCPPGTLCAAGLFCVDGYCCHSACSDSCTACNVVGLEGTCSPVPRGSKPKEGRPACGPGGTLDPTNCKEDGTCDGAGHCAMFELGTTCKPSSCDPVGHTETPTSTCDGHGNCTTPSPLPCAPFRCNGTTACYSTCTGDDQCQGDKKCEDQSCGPKSLGARCSVESECASGKCVDGVCCDDTCTAGCMACNLPLSLGHCTNVPVGQDPRRNCPTGAGANAACSPGGCNGANGCTRAATTVQCAASTCSDGTENSVALCQDDGTCAARTTARCAPYSCGASACATSCAESTPCATGYYCDGNAVCNQRIAPGGECSLTDQCQAGLTCLDRVCCTSSSCPTCRNCGAHGACDAMVASGPDDTGITCNGTSTCDPMGSCLLSLGSPCGLNSECISNHCVDGVCCNTGECPECTNCAPGKGTCSILLKNQDDDSGKECLHDKSCNGNGTCTARWEALRTNVAPPGLDFYAASGTKLYFANNSNYSATPYFKSFDVGTGTISDESLARSDLCLCGNSANFVHGNGSVFYLGNTARYYVDATTGWTDLASFPTGAQVAGAPGVTVGNTIYRFGGVGPSTAVKSVYSYTFTSASPAGGTWSADLALANMPVALASTCAAESGGSVYVFAGGQASTLVYDIAHNSWTTLPTSTNAPLNCFETGGGEGYVWRSRIVVADAVLYLFDLSSKTWLKPVPLPSVVNRGAALVPTDGNLYLLGGTTDGTVMTIYRWAFD